MEPLHQTIESLLFLESKPLTLKRIATVCGVAEPEAENAVRALQLEYDQRNGGVTIVREGDRVQMMTAASQAETIRKYVEDQQTGELTRPSLETLTIIAYRGPVAKSEIELIRGINCSLILRNLMIRGLIEEDGETEAGSPIYRVTLDFLRFLGINKTSELPEFAELNKNVHLQEMLDSNKNPEDFFSK